MPRVLFASFALFLVACAPAASTGGTVAPPPAPPDRMVFMAGFKPQANLPFVAAYVAKDRGYFREQNLDVEIQHSAGQGEHVRLATAGVVQVTTATGMNVVSLAADPGLPLVALAVFGQRSDQAFAVRAETPIRTAKDFEGKVVAFPPSGSPMSPRARRSSASAHSSSDLCEPYCSRPSGSARTTSRRSTS